MFSSRIESILTYASTFFVKIILSTSSFVPDGASGMGIANLTFCSIVDLISPPSCVRLLLLISASTAFRSLEVLFCVFCHSAEVATDVNTLDLRVIIRTRRSLDLSCCSIVIAENCLKDDYSIMLKSDCFFSMEILYLTILSFNSFTLQVIVTDHVP